MSSPSIGCADLTCITNVNNQISGDNLITSFWINAIIGALCFAGFTWWRKYFGIYTCRLSVPGVRKRPPPLPINGHRRFWSWLTPMWAVTDKEYLSSAGFDALVSIRIIAFGIALLVPVTLFGIGVVMPVNYTSNFLEAQANTSFTNSNTTYVFLRMTISNVPDGSPLLWIHFIFLVFIVVWTCYLLLIFYEEHIAMCHTVAMAKIGPAHAPEILEGQDAEEIKELIAEGGVEDGTMYDCSGTFQSDTSNLVNSKTRIEDSNCTVGIENTASDEVKYDLWPVRRGVPQHLSSIRPPNAGQYVVLCMDEPPKKFSIRRQWFGMPIRLTNVDSLREAQDSMSSRNDFYWIQKSKWSQNHRHSIEDGKEETVNKHGSHVNSNTLKQRKNFLLRGKDAAISLVTCLVKNKKAEEVKMAMSVQARMKVVAATFENLFGDDFNSIVPIYATEVLDSALLRLYRCQVKRARLEVSLENLRKSMAHGDDPSQNTKILKRVEYLEGRVAREIARDAELSTLVTNLQENIFQSTPCQSFFATFRSAKAAAMAAELNVNPLHWRGMYITSAPDADNVNWPTLQKSWWSRTIRSAIVLFFIILIMIFPLGAFTGLFSQLGSALCGGQAGSTGSLNGSWFCSNDWFAQFLRNVITGIVPVILMSVYQALILPVYIYACAQSEALHISLTDLDLRCAALFFHWNWCNFFLQSLLGGAIFSGLRQAIDNPRNIIPLLGQAVPSASNFFVNYVLYRALAMTFFRLFYPHASIFPEILKFFRLLSKPKTPQDIAFSNPLRNCRYSRDIGVSVFAVYVCTLSYACISPFILPIALVYFSILVFVWRYQQLYIYQSAYNSRGRFWLFAAHRIIACLTIMTLFTAAMFFVKHAFVQGTIALVGLESFLIGFNRYVKDRYDSIFADMPIAVLEAAPQIELDPDLYIPPPLRKGAQGWSLEWGKAWQGWGAPRYSF